MTADQSELGRILADQGGVISRRQHPELDGSIAWLARTGRLTRLFPGIYLDPAHPDPVAVRMRAVPLWDPDAVLTGAAAARLTFWPGLRVDRVEVATRHHRVTAPGYTVVQRVLDPDLIDQQDGLRVTRPAVTALDLCLARGGSAIDAALRSRQVQLTDLHAAMEVLPCRRGNRKRRHLLLDSRDAPWSEAERDAHRLLRDAGLTGWVANYPFPMLAWTYYIDIAFPAARLAIEIDGREFHSSPEAFESDRERQNHLVLAGWRVLRFTYGMLTRHPRVVLASIRRALAA